MLEALRCDETKIIPRLLFLWLWGTDGQSAIRANYQGAAIGGINQSFIKKISIPLPPLSEQKRIIKILEEKQTVVEKAKKVAEEKLEAATKLSNSYIVSIFNSQQARNWPVVKLIDISSLITDGPHITPNYLPIGIPFLTVKNIIQERIDLTDVSYISRNNYEEFSNRAKAELGDILYTKDGTLGIPCLIDVEFEFSFFVSVALIKIRKDFVNPKFIVLALKSPSVKDQVKKMGEGAGLKHMVIKSLHFPKNRLLGGQFH